jgi:sterol desaturase/sphingolipid hydroxylase (fatty acid hydroxylase superfamily)
MGDAMLAAEPAVRLGCFLAVLAAVGLWEARAPRRRLTLPRLRRWPGNLGVAVVGTILLRLVLPVAAVGVAVIAARRSWGLLNQLELPALVAVPLAILLLDLAIYAQHVAFHHVAPLWRLHRMHHADLDIDVTTGLRFHPLEILLSMAIKIAVVVAIGAPALAVLLFEVLLNATSLFNHGNLRLTGRADRLLRLLVVTPEMHRVHHSVLRAETDSNFGFNLPWWDRLFGTYRAEPAAGHLGMTIGLPEFRAPRELRLDRMLLQPFRRAEETAAGGTPRRDGRSAA